MDVDLSLTIISRETISEHTIYKYHVLESLRSCLDPLRSFLDPRRSIIDPERLFLDLDLDIVFILSAFLLLST